MHRSKKKLSEEITQYRHTLAKEPLHLGHVILRSSYMYLYAQMIVCPMPKSRTDF